MYIVNTNTNDAIKCANYKEFSENCKALRLNPSIVYHEGQNGFIRLTNAQYKNGNVETPKTLVNTEITYDKLREDAEANNDEGFCAVIAVAIAANIDYATAYDFCKKAGRVHRKGMLTNHIQMALDLAGVDHKHARKTVKGMFAPKSTVRIDCLNQTFTRVVKELPKDKTFLVLTKRHITAVRNGEIQDWMTDKNNRHIVESCIEITS